MNTFLPHPSWTRRQALGFIVGMSGSFVLKGCTNPNNSSPSTASNLTSIRLGITPWIGLTPLYIAKESGLFQEVELDLQIRSFSSVQESIPSFVVGQNQGIVPVISEAVALAAQGADYRIVLVQDTSVGADAVLARNSIASIKDFKGKKIAVQKGAVSHFFLLQVLAEAGLSEKDVILIDAEPAIAAAAYEAGSVEITCSYSPYVNQANANQKDGRIIYDSSKMPSAIADVYAFRTEFIESSQQTVKAFVSCILKGLDFLNTNPNDGLVLAAKHFDLEPEVLKTQLRGIQLPNVKTNREMLANPQSDLYLLKPMQAIAEFLKSQNQIETIPDLSNLIDPQFVIALDVASIVDRA
ncbi:MAG: ABC transporter substrate-binding protein [Cyanobacteria bacterium CRU_2_1]|nr:ABC transporter substrate-binding protein [Cyanobacteria bacterium RU_5_0]NJR57986.1 ABC transporter substrate-binding protein [Cyanobacteria bacterium CRU_2_1]